MQIRKVALVTITLFIIPLVRGLYNGSSENLKNVMCVSADGENLSEDDNVENISSRQPYQKCENTTNYCFAAWTELPETGAIKILKQGCWVTSGKSESCEQLQCISKSKPTKAKSDTKFCCCMGDNCNANFTDAYPSNATDTDESTSPPTKVLPKYTLNPVVWALSAVVSVLFSLVLFLCIKQKMNKDKNDVESGQHPIPSPPDYSLDKLKLCNIIGQGQYGSVWQGIIDDQEVAVKVFPAHHRNYFLNEHDLFKVAGECSALLKCYGGGERVSAPGGVTEYLLILNLERMCLQEYLKNNTLDLGTLCKMSLGVAKGLAHLHSDIGKPCIAHRDINTRNILVRADLSCCICDLGLAVIPRRTENRSLSEAGTLRYMAPEVLEGAVNLRDCECALKQIDVYALGLVLWELGTRCTDMQNAEPQPYAPPFYREAGENPSLEQMQALVSRRKARPLWPSSWKDTAAARLLCETAEDCWDQDAEARLTSLCVEERLLDLPVLRGRILHPMRPPASPTPLINNNHLHGNAMEASVGTIETLLSPTEEHCKNSNQLAACVTPLQPYQGRNPCLERNLLTTSSDSLLIDKSSKHCTSSESQNLITNDFLNYQINHRATPIPYLQNAVHGGPKQCNTAIPPSEKHVRFKWSVIKKIFHHKKNNNVTTCKDTQVKLLPNKLVNNFGQNDVRTLLLNDNDAVRPSTLPLNVVQTNHEQKPNLSGISQILKNKNSVSKQQSLEQFSEMFSSTSDLARLKDPSQRIKTPGDVPPSVRRTRGKAAKESARFSLYDDSIMCRGQWGSAPDLEPNVPPLQPPKLQDVQDRDSVSSF